jgi:glyoxylase-like metal-dependent hydrolase (beta-lactamase superfamily II)
MNQLVEASTIDRTLAAASALIEEARRASALRPVVRSFFDEPTFTASHVIHNPASLAAAIIDPVLDFDPASGRTGHRSADEIAAYVEAHQLEVRWLLETHAHADHLSAAPYLKQRLGGTLAIGRENVAVQQVFGALFNEGSDFRRDGSQFDRLFDDGDSFAIGSLCAQVLHVPGHTPADLAYVIGHAVFCGDTLFMPDYGTARADFPGGDARRLYRSIRRLLSLPRETRLFLCHDYRASGREQYVWETTIGAQRDDNVHVQHGIDEDGFVAMRMARDLTLGIPRLILPSVQVNMRGGQLPPPEANGTRYLKLPLDVL